MTPRRTGRSMSTWSAMAGRSPWGRPGARPNPSYFCSCWSRCANSCPCLTAPRPDTLSANGRAMRSYSSRRCMHARWRYRIKAPQTSSKEILAQSHALLGYGGWEACCGRGAGVLCTASRRAARGRERSGSGSRGGAGRGDGGRSPSATAAPAGARGHANLMSERTSRVTMINAVQ